MAAKKPTKASPSWSDVKTQLADFDRTGLIGLVQDLYAASKDNQIFLHARFGLGEDVLRPYKVTIDRWLRPDVYKNQDYSVAKAKKPIADYKKAIGHPAGLAELMVFYSEQAIDFSSEFGLDDEGYYSALVRMFEQALKVVVNLPEPERESFLDRLDDVRTMGRKVGWDVGDEFNALWRGAGLETGD